MELPPCLPRHEEGRLRTLLFGGGQQAVQRGSLPMAGLGRLAPPSPPSIHRVLTMGQPAAAAMLVHDPLLRG
jgi:hypothetical protein